MTQMIQGGSVTAPAPEKRKETELLLAELVLLSAAAAALSRAPLTKAERARRLRPILARRVVVESLLFPAE